MVIDLVNQLAGMSGVDMHFDDYIIWTRASNADPWLPRVGNALAIDGTVAVAGYTEASQCTFTFFDTAFNMAKLIILDFASLDDWTIHPASLLTTPESNVVAAFVNSGNAWASRANLRPSSVRHVAKTLNEKLRRAYHQS
jgi:hypothetical protein